MNRKKKRKLIRFTFISIALLFIFFGVTTLMKGNLHYTNYWGGLVFAPVALLIGVILLFVAIFKGTKF